MTEVPCDEVVDLVKRSEGDMDGIGKIFSVEYPAFDVAFGEDRNLVGDFKFLERADEVEIA